MHAGKSVREVFEKRPNYVIWVISHTDRNKPEWKPMFEFVEALEERAS